MVEVVKDMDKVWCARIYIAWSEIPVAPVMR